jgi:O-antigen/teichoic acid export membrane protein
VAGIYIVRTLEIKFIVNKEYIKDAVLFGLPLVPAAVGWWVASGIDRLFINSMISIEATGLYAVGYQVGMIISLMVASFNQAWWPFLYDKLQKNSWQDRIQIVRITYVYIIVIFACALGLSYIAPFLLKVFVGKEFYDGYKYVFWIALAYAFNGMRYMILNYVYYAKKTYITAWIPFVCGGLNLVLNYYLIKMNGAIGAAQATTFTFFIAFIMTWLVSAKIFKMPWVKALQFSR